MTRFGVVLAGGLGTRLRAVTGGLIPKVLAPVNGRPFLAYKLEEMRTLGFTEVLLLLGERGALVDEYLAENPFPEMKVFTSHDGPTLLGTAGAIGSVLPILPEMFWVTYGDTLVRAELSRAEELLLPHPRSGLMTVLHNRDHLQPSNCAVCGESVVAYSKVKGHQGFDWLDYGLLLLRREHFVDLPSTEQTDLSVVVQRLIEQKCLLAMEVFDRFWDVGTPESLEETQLELKRRGSR